MLKKPQDENSEAQTTCLGGMARVFGTPAVFYLMKIVIAMQMEVLLLVFYTSNCLIRSGLSFFNLIILSSLD
jgi:hypothetical protein